MGGAQYACGREACGELHGCGESPGKKVVTVTAVSGIAGFFSGETVSERVWGLTRGLAWHFPKHYI